MFDTVPADWVAEFGPPDDQTPTAFYVTSSDRERILLLAGPFPRAGEAQFWVDTVQDLLLNAGRVEIALSVQVSRMHAGQGRPRPGDLNAQLELS